MSETLDILQRKLGTARDLKSVVRTIKAITLSSIAQYEEAVHSLGGYYHAVELGLAVCFREKAHPMITIPERLDGRFLLAIVFGSDQGLAGQFNEHVVSLAASELARSHGRKVVWAAGERSHTKLQELGHPANRLYAVPNSVQAITPLVSQILVDMEPLHDRSEVYLFYNQPKSRVTYEPVKQRLTPLDDRWLGNLSRIKWPTKMLPQVVGAPELTVTALIREYLFVSLFRACAESLASENASRLAAMQRAQRNIEDLLERLRTSFNQTRQDSIGEELFDVVSGFEVLANSTS